MVTALVPLIYVAPCTHACGSTWHGLAYLAVVAAIALIGVVRGGSFGRLRRHIHRLRRRRRWNHDRSSIASSRRHR